MDNLCSLSRSVTVVKRFVARTQNEGGGAGSGRHARLKKPRSSRETKEDEASDYSKAAEENGVLVDAIMIDELRTCARGPMFSALLLEMVDLSNRTSFGIGCKLYTSLLIF